MESPWTKPIKLELKVADIISKQAKHGCNFNKRKANWLVYQLNESVVNIDKKLIPMLPPMLNKGSTYNRPFKLNGDFQKWPGEYCERVGLKRDEVGGPFSAVWFTPFDPGKVDKVKNVLLDNGWIPTEWNEKKMPFQIWTYRKRLNRTSYSKFIESLPAQERSFYSDFVNDFIEQHFKNKSKNYMKAVLFALDFNPNYKVPDFNSIKKKLLLKQFWPTSPKITEDSFESVADGESEMLQLLKERMVLCHRRSLIEGLIKVTRSDGKISGEAASCATPTARMKHRKIVNIPAARAKLGKELRNLFIGDERVGAKPLILKKNLKEGVRLIPNTNRLEEWSPKKNKWVKIGTYRNLIPKGFDSFVGGDGAALELRMLAHYLVSIPQMLMDKAIEDGDEKAEQYYRAALISGIEYRSQILDGDIHSHNQQLAGLPTRDAAKTFIYAFLYGAGDANLGAQLGSDANAGAELRARFLEQCPCIPVLIEWVQKFAVNGGMFKGYNYKPGTIPAIDGRPLIMRRDAVTGEVATHKALNTLLQAAGSIVMKVGMCFLNVWIDKEGIDCHQVIMMHRTHCASKIV